jgi:hypothetical protein
LEEAAMSNYLETDFCTKDEGLDYIFGRMLAIFGASFNRHFDGINPEFVRDEWKNQLGRFLTYRPSMDYAIDRLDGEFVPSAIKFRNLCNAGPHIPSKPILLIEKQMTEAQKQVIEKHKAQAREWLAKMKSQKV